MEEIEINGTEAINLNEVSLGREKTNVIISERSIKGKCQIAAKEEKVRVINLKKKEQI